jgi:mannitol-specific phosphotransferase system IIBC component
LNNLAIVVRIAVLSFLLVSSFFLQTQKAYEKDAYGQGYGVKELKDSHEDTEEEEEAMEEAEEYDDYDDD